jgi:hypothetical protein
LTEGTIAIYSYKYEVFLRYFNDLTQKAENVIQQIDAVIDKK